MNFQFLPIVFIGIFQPALADTGPCKLDAGHEIQIYGSGDGAAIVIRDTASPSKKIALAWRTPERCRPSKPDDDK